MLVWPQQAGSCVNLGKTSECPATKLKWIPPLWRSLLGCSLRSCWVSKEWHVKNPKFRPPEGFQV